MSHLLWKFYWDNDVDKFRRLLAPASHNTQAPSRSPAIGSGSWGHSPNAGGPGTSPRASKSRKVSGFGAGFGGSKGSPYALGKAEVNSRDHAGLTVLLRASSSPAPSAVSFVEALLEHPALDLHVQDPESGWNALHRALYAGNISIARLLLEKERSFLTEQILSSSVAKVGQLIKTKDHEGYSPFDVYNSTIAVRDLSKSLDVDDDSDAASDSGASSNGDYILARSVAALDGVTEGEEIFMFGSNKNLSLGVGDEDDRQFPERVNLKRPDHLLSRFLEEYLEESRNDPALAASAALVEPDDLGQIPALTKHRPMRIHDAVLSKFHTVILTSDPVSNMYICGVGRSGRLGLGDENTQFRFTPVQSGLQDKKVVQAALGQNHTMALTSHGEVWTWGSNGNSQLGYTLPPARPDEEQMSTTPRQVFGALKKETILGVAASCVHSVAHTATSLFCWGRNLGQLALMDADSRSLEVQSTPRKVAASLFSSNIVAVSAIDKATTCLLEDSSVCVFTSYGYNFVKFPVPDVFANQQFTPRSVATRYDSSRNAIKSISSGGETIAAISTRGDLFTISLNHKAEAAPAATSTTNPAKIKGALTTPQCIWNARKDGVRSVSVGEHGSVIICTESGAVWRRIKRAKAKDAGPGSGSAGLRRNDFKFQRVPAVNDAVTVRSSTFGAFAAIRKDCDVMKQQITVDRQSLAKDLAPLLCLRGFRASDPVTKDKDILKFWNNQDLKDRIGELPYELLKSMDLDADLVRHITFNASHAQGADVLVSTTSSPDVAIPVHGWLLAARSPVLRGIFAEYRAEGEYEIPDTLMLEEHQGKTLIKFHALDLVSLVNMVVYCYDDTAVPAWNFTRQAPPLAYRYRQIRAELMKLAAKLQMMKLEAAVRLQTTVEKSLDQDLRLAIEDPAFFEDADAIVELNGDEVAVHSQLLRQRCEFFEGLFHGRTGGMWLAGRQDLLDEEEQVRIDLQHFEPDAFRYAMRFLYADVGTELFNDVVSSDIDDFSDLVMHVMSIANELMLDRLSQICQFVLGKFVTSRNIGLLLNEISPCAVTEFKDAGLEYVCLQMETMLENHFLDEVDEDLLEELDDIVRQNQVARYPFVRSGRAERLLYEQCPELISDIEEERQIRVKEMAYKASQKDDERKLSTSLKAARFGSLDDLSGAVALSETARRKSKAGRNEPFSPVLRPKESKADLMFDMDEDHPLSSVSPAVSPLQRAVDDKSVPGFTSLPSLAASLKESAGPLGADAAREVVPSSPAAMAGPSPSTPYHSSAGLGKGKASADKRPWGGSALPTSKLDLREMLAATPPKSALAASLAAQKTPEGSPRITQPKMSQKERKKQQQAQAAAQAALEATEKAHKVAWDTQSPGSKVAPWKPVSAGTKTSLQEVMASDKPVPASTANPKPLIAAETTPRSTPRRTASPDTRFSGQSKGTSSPSVPTSSSNRPSAKPVVPHSKSYKTNAPKPEPVLGLSMTDIIGQQRREQEIVKEAVAKRSMQEIQQEQEFQEWWDQESRRIQDEEARKSAREERDREEKPGNRRGRRGRTGKGGAEGAASQTEGRVDGGAASTGKAAGSSGNAKGRSSRGRGGKGPTGKAST